ncbi:hypothetical protein ACROYT_G014033 [Oculina patagonica]
MLQFGGPNLLLKDYNQENPDLRKRQRHLERCKDMVWKSSETSRLWNSSSKNPLALEIPRCRLWYGMDIFWNHPIPILAVSRTSICPKPPFNVRKGHKKATEKERWNYDDEQVALKLWAENIEKIESKDKRKAWQIACMPSSRPTPLEQFLHVPGT